MKAQERLYFTAQKDRLVAHGSPQAAFLYASVGDEIPESAAAKFGIVDGRLKGGKPPANKEKKPQGDKERQQDGDKNKAPKPDDLTQVSGVGAATVKVLAGLGITSFAALAAADAAKLRADGAFRPVQKVEDWIAGAAALVVKAEPPAT